MPGKPRQILVGVAGPMVTREGGASSGRATAEVVQEQERVGQLGYGGVAEHPIELDPRPVPGPDAS
jgi:hypothetical protein